MSNDLVSPSDLRHLPGAPFSDTEVDTAVAMVQSALGWHVAPILSQTLLLLMQPYEGRLRLPTKKLVSVTSISVKGVLMDPINYEVIRSRNHIVLRSGSYWPCGETEITFRHGFDETPGDLLPVIAEAAAIARRDESVKPYRLSFVNYEGEVPLAYAVNKVPGMA